MALGPSLMNWKSQIPGTRSPFLSKLRPLVPCLFCPQVCFSHVCFLYDQPFGAENARKMRLGSEVSSTCARMEQQSWLHA